MSIDFIAVAGRFAVWILGMLAALEAVTQGGLAAYHGLLVDMMAWFLTGFLALGLVILVEKVKLRTGA